MEYSPLDSSKPTEHPVLFVDKHAPVPDLLACATQRITAARDMLDSVSCMSSRHSDGIDLMRFSNVAALLLQDGCDVLRIVETRLEDAGVHIRLRV
ncbi:hypothetical protein NLK61_26445 [Pseudomonas fuscovaginae UPB0736]|uniref:DUF3077 domain-containing protein n=1 Tax=Pseudomonas asplenii TaxID=53407 RepID=A0A1H6NW86_9PSED|nr:hypothetical protein [Pseudomonas fuscovaginae]UUQ64699.1 hypothetical protein NLK61_26445 [Pseudomonas fuscovaginae UPB0736]SEI21069.1 hypothetical protein SAMN05216581_4387 [Pseudomonas fuscovaginae]